jgi:cytochrome P450
MTGGYDGYDSLRANSPIRVQQGLRETVIYVIGHQEAKQILGDHKRFVKDFRNTLQLEERGLARSGTDTYSLLYNNMLNTDRPDHTRLRALVSKAFTNRQIQSLAPRIQEIAEQLIDGFEFEGEIDLIDAYAFPLPIIVICELLGVPVEDRDKFRKWSHAFIGITDDETSYGQSLYEFVRTLSSFLLRPIAIQLRFRMRPPWTSSANRINTWDLATGFIVASALRWLAWRPEVPSTLCCDGFQPFG